MKKAFQITGIALLGAAFFFSKGMAIMISQFESASQSETSTLEVVPLTEGPSLLTSLLSLASTDEEPGNPFNLLIAGKHGANVDTMIFAQIDPLDETVHLISIPRDLHHQDRKINSVYADYGMEELTKRISEISGQPITEYILVDMYVFKDLVDLIGGIDITLTEDLVDPSYKIIEEDGTETTLNYPAGDYHLSGTEALRIARSRHTTSDYSRAARQQIILDGIRVKAQELGFGDALTILQIIQTVLANTETNISLEKATLYYLNYKDFLLNHGYVLSTSNALDMKLLPVDYETSMQVEVCEDVAGEQVCETKNAIYTLQPHEDDWDYVKWYFDGILGS
jgi:polyisoprenyl-teichoic acid--peptidoglycan teichoic acid transferase